MRVKKMFDNYSLDNFKTDYYFDLKGVVFQSVYSKTKIYQKGDVVQDKAVDCLFHEFESLQDDNVNHPLTDPAYWKDNGIVNNLLTVDKFELLKEESSSKNFFVLDKTDKSALRLELLTCYMAWRTYCFIGNKGFSTTSVSSASIVSMSVGGEKSEFFKKNPWFDNPLGQRYVFLYNMFKPFSFTKPFYKDPVVNLDF